jgi:general secretion pathway protein I
MPWEISNLQPSRNDNGQAGFTLLEVMVALAIVAIALGSMIRATGEASVNEAYLQEKTLANWVAINRMAELRIQGLVPKPGSRQTGFSEMADLEWPWRQTAIATPDPNIVRIEITVGKDGDYEGLATLTGFLGIQKASPSNAPANP